MKVEIRSNKIGNNFWLTTIYLNGEIFKCVEAVNMYQARLNERKFNSIINKIKGAI